MTCQTSAHIVVDYPFGYPHLGQISVTPGAGNASLIMRSMTELNVGPGRKTVDAHPRDFNLLVCISDDLLNLRILIKNPQVQKVIAYADKKIEIPWVRVYGFSPGAHVQFRHAPHYQAGVPCTRCHGDLTKMGVAERVVNHNMGTCLTCHRQNNAPEDCAACHY